MKNERRIAIAIVAASSFFALFALGSLITRNIPHLIFATVMIGILWIITGYVNAAAKRSHFQR